MLPLDSKKTTWKSTVFEVSVLQSHSVRLRHSMTSSRLGAVPPTAQYTFCTVPGTGYRSSQNADTSVLMIRVGMTSLVGVLSGPVKLTYPLLPTHRLEKLPPPKGIGNGGLSWAEESSLSSRLVPAMVRQAKAVGE